MTISIGSDHAGFLYKEALKQMLVDDGYVVLDVGTYSAESVDYPDYGVAAAHLVRDDHADRGVLICGSGIGISIAANKVRGVRAANCTSVEMAQLSRMHNDANMVAVGQRIVSLELAQDIVRAFMTTEFEGGRHSGRVDKIDALGDLE
ncbi:MAG: ribose 5-phosphate isomerase B [Candidatus Kapabacteria bacterium]|nr:ribose 5-phosphate isomerase B [Candidatus Kapabacteria bacterium]